MESPFNTHLFIRSINIYQAPGTRGHCEVDGGYEMKKTFSCLQGDCHGVGRAATNRAQTAVRQAECEGL